MFYIGKDILGNIRSVMPVKEDRPDWLPDKITFKTVHPHLGCNVDTEGRKWDVNQIAGGRVWVAPYDQCAAKYSTTTQMQGYSIVYHACPYAWDKPS